MVVQYPFVTPTGPSNLNVKPYFVGVAATALSDARAALYYNELAVLGVVTQGLVYIELYSGLGGEDAVYGGRIFCHVELNKRATLCYDFAGKERSDYFDIGFLIARITPTICSVYITNFTRSQ